MIMFNSYVSHYQRINPIKPPLNHHFPMVFLWSSYVILVPHVLYITIDDHQAQEPVGVSDIRRDSATGRALEGAKERTPGVFK